MKIYYKSGYKYQLHNSVIVGTDVKPSFYIDTHYISLATNGTLHIRRGYAWDGPSGLTIDTKSSMRGSLVHDALYELLRMGNLHSSTRKSVDKELYRICVEDGMWKWRARAWYAVVRKAAAGAASPKNRKPLYIAGN